ncbi:MAG: hypothetical protein ORN54_03965 [Cyclobacteriaceae bacterium]|nr:hypothetical protein [Cyclobacteriaceae bacterium]
MNHRLAQRLRQIEKQVFIGKGAGGYPTGSAVLSDVSAHRHEMPLPNSMPHDQQHRITGLLPF